MLGRFVAALLVVCSPFAFGTKYDCATVNQFYAAVIRIQLNAPKTLNVDCEATSGKLALALYTLYHEAEPLYQFVRENSLAIVLEKSSDGKYLAIGDPRTNRIQVFPNLFKRHIQDIMVQIVHEAAHLYTRAPHVKCVAGLFKGWTSCDAHFTGSWTGGATNFELMAIRYLRNITHPPTHFRKWLFPVLMDNALERLNHVNGTYFKKWEADIDSLTPPPLNRDIKRKESTLLRRYRSPQTKKKAAAGFPLRPLGNFID